MDALALLALYRQIRRSQPLAAARLLEVAEAIAALTSDNTRTVSPD